MPEDPGGPHGCSGRAPAAGVSRRGPHHQRAGRPSSLRMGPLRWAGGGAAGLGHAGSMRPSQRRTSEGREGRLLCPSTSSSMATAGSARA